MTLISVRCFSKWKASQSSLRRQTGRRLRHQHSLNFTFLDYQTWFCNSVLLIQCFEFFDISERHFAIPNSWYDILSFSWLSRYYGSTICYSETLIQYFEFFEIMRLLLSLSTPDINFWVFWDFGTITERLTSTKKIHFHFYTTANWPPLLTAEPILSLYWGLLIERVARSA